MRSVRARSADEAEDELAVLVEKHEALSDMRSLPEFKRTERRVAGYRCLA